MATNIYQRQILSDPSTAMIPDPWGSSSVSYGDMPVATAYSPTYNASALPDPWVNQPSITQQRLQRLNNLQGSIAGKWNKVGDFASKQSNKTLNFYGKPAQAATRSISPGNLVGKGNLLGAGLNTGLTFYGNLQGGMPLDENLVRSTGTGVGTLAGTAAGTAAGIPIATGLSGLATASLATPLAPVAPVLYGLSAATPFITGAVGGMFGSDIGNKTFGGAYDLVAGDQQNDYQSLQQSAMDDYYNALTRDEQEALNRYKIMNDYQNNLMQQNAAIDARRMNRYAALQDARDLEAAMTTGALSEMGANIRNAEDNRSSQLNTIANKYAQLNAAQTNALASIFA